MKYFCTYLFEKGVRLYVQQNFRQNDVETDIGMTSELLLRFRFSFSFNALEGGILFMIKIFFFGSSAKLIFLEDASSFWKFLFWQKIAALPNRYGIQTFLFAPIIFQKFQ